MNLHAIFSHEHGEHQANSCKVDGSQGSAQAAGGEGGAENEGDASWEFSPRQPLWSGTVVLRDIHKLRKWSELLVRKLPFERLVCEVAEDRKLGMRFQAGYIEALQHTNNVAIIDCFKKTRLRRSTLSTCRLCPKISRWRCARFVAGAKVSRTTSLVKNLVTQIRIVCCDALQ